MPIDVSTLRHFSYDGKTGARKNNDIGRAVRYVQNKNNCLVGMLRGWTDEMLILQITKEERDKFGLRLRVYFFPAERCEFIK